MSRFVLALLLGAAPLMVLAAAVERVDGWKRDSGLQAVEGDFTAAFTFRWHGYAPIPAKMGWRNGMIASHR